MIKRIVCLLVGLTWLCAGAAQAAKTIYLTYTDAQGTVVAETDVEGNIVARYDYRPYGAPVSGALPEGPGYTGHVNDPDSGLVYMQARYYDPASGMLSLDPVKPAPGNVFSFNRYAYALNNPIRNIDPDGRQAEEELRRGERQISEGQATREAINESVGRLLVGQIRSIDPSYRLPQVAGPVGGTYFNEVTNGVLARDLAELQRSGPRMCVAPSTSTPITKWRLGADPYSSTAKGNFPAWSTIRSRFWKNAAARSTAAETFGSENLGRMARGRAPQRYNPDKGGMESMELSHEPVPAREGGRDVLPRWPQDHAIVDPYRRPGY